jgi:hypothetical protein
MDTYTVQPAGGYETNEHGFVVDGAGKPKPIDTFKPETMKAIAAKLGVGADAIFAANRDVIGSNPANLAIGMVLAVPDKAEKED